MTTRSSLAVFSAFLVAWSANAHAADRSQPPNSLTEAEQQAGWKLLFDGTTTAGWRGYRMEAMPPGWDVIDGALVRVRGGAGGKGAGGGDDIVTTEEFDNFELQLEWKVRREGNSGVLYHVSEEPATAWHYAPEVQILDNSAHPGRDERQLAGACYDLYAPSKDATKPPGQWNQMRIRVEGPHVTHWMNGEQIVEYELWSDDWNRRVANSKHKIRPQFGTFKKGPICLQDHTDRIEFRNIKIRPLPEPSHEPVRQRRSQPREQSGGRHAPPSHPDVSYGPHERNVMDVWLAPGERPTPVLVAIHGGGFMQGQKHVHPRLREECLASGISVVAITYRLSSAEARAPAQFLDAARAIQFIRYKARDWHLDPDRIAAAGGSAGAGLSLWLGFHDDLADPDSRDPVLRQSSRLTCMAVFNAQTSYDPRVIRELLPESDAYEHVALAKLFDVDLSRLDELPREKYQLFEEVSPITHLTRDDPPALLAYESEMDTPPTTQSIGIHHPRFGQMLKEQMDKLGIESRVYTGVRKNSQEWTRLTMDFAERRFGMKP